MYIAICLSCLACSRQNSDSVAKRPNEPDVVSVKNDDKEMNAAIRTAQATLDDFIKQITAPNPNQTYFSVKARFEDGKNIEHIWIKVAVFINGVFKGKIGNEPLDLSTVKLGEPVTITRERVSDWMIVENGILKGGYTIRVLRNRMPIDERKTFDAELHFRFE